MKILTLWFEAVWTWLLLFLCTPAFPDDALFAIHPESFYTAYKTIIWVTAALVSVLLGLVVFLSTAMIRRRSAEEALRRSEERMRLFFERQLVGMAITSPQKGWLQFNDELCEMLGYSRDELSRLTWAELTHPDDLAPDVAQFDQLLAGEIDEYSIEKRFLRKDGTVVPTSLSVGCVRTADGSVDYVLVLLMDITERKRAEMALRDSEARFRALIRNSQDVIAVYTAEGVTTYLSPAVQKILGYTPEELIGVNGFSLVHPDDLESVKGVFGRVIREGGLESPFEYRCRHADGSWVYLESVGGNYLDDPAIRGVVVNTREITGRKRVEEALHASEHKFRYLAEKAVVGVYLIQDGLFRYVNARFANIHGYTVAEMTGQMGVLDTVSPEHRPLVAENIRKRLMEEEPPLTATFRIVTRTGEIRDVEVYSIGTLYQGRPAIIGTAVDITERKQAETALRASEERFRTLIESSPMPIVIAREGILIYVNTAFSLMVGADSAEEMINTSLLESLAPENREEVLRYIAARSRNEEAPIRYETVCIRRDGTRVPCEINVARVNLADGPAQIGYVADISERKRTEEALEKRLVALTRPLGERGEVAFEDLFNLTDLQRLQDHFSTACGVGSLITYPDGTPITRPSYFSSLCDEIIRSTPKGRSNCRHSDGRLGRYNASGPIIEPCLYIGLRNAGASITVGGRHLANWLIGQVRDEAQNEEDVLAYAREIGADEGAFRAAYRQIPTMSEERFEQIAQALFVLTDQLSTIAYQNIQQARFIHERRRAEEALRQNEGVLRSLLEATPAGVALLVDRVLLKVNAAFCRIVGYPEEELVGKSTRMIYENDEEFDRVGRDAYSEMEREGLGVTEMCIMRKDGAMVDILLCLSPFDPKDAAAGVTATLLDITDRKRTENALRASEAFLETIIEQSPHAMSVYDHEGVLVRMNQACRDMLQISDEEVVGKYNLFEDNIVEEQGMMPLVRRAYERGEKVRFSLDYDISRLHSFEREGTPQLILDITISPVLDAQQRVVNTVIQQLDVTEQKKAEEALKSAKKWFEDVVEFMPDAILIADKDHKTIAWNRAIEKMTGIPKAAILGLDHHEATVGFYGEMRKSLIDLVFVDDVVLAARYSKVRRVGSTLYAEAYTPAVYNNRGAYVLVAVSPFYDEAGNLVGIIEAIRDITEVKHAEKELRESEEKFRRITENMSDLVSELDAHGTYRYVTPSFLPILGYLPQDLIGDSAFDRIHPEDEERVMTVFMEVVRTGEHREVEYRYRRADGSYAWLRSSGRSLRDAQCEVLGVIIVSSDITQRKIAEEEARRWRNYLGNIINSMPSVLVGVDTGGRVTQWNAAAERATGVEAGKAQGQPLDRLLPMLRPQLDKLWEAMQTRAVSTQAKVPRVVDGEMRYEDVTIYPLVSNGVEGVVIRVDDVTERVRIEEMIVQSEKMLSVGGLAAGMAHEINNPLGVILQAAQNIIRRVSPELPVNARVADECGVSFSGLKQYLERREILTFIEDIRQSGERASEIVANMLNFSRRAEGGGVSTDLADLLDRTVSLAASDYDLKKHYDFRQVQIVRDYHPETPRVVCQPGKIQQVFLNILRNGAQAMWKASGSDREPCFRLRVLRDEEMVRVEIEDNGPGMEEAIRKRVFEPFFTTKPPGSGTGLGLSVSYFIVTEEHGGTITVESSPGVGSRFIIQLPVMGNRAARI